MTECLYGNANIECCVMQNHLFIFSCDQAALRPPPSVCLSVRLSVTPFSLCSCHRIITKFSGVITNGRSDVHQGWGQLHNINSTPTPTPTPEVSTPTPSPTPANLQKINSNSNSNSGGFNSDSNSNSGVGVEPNSNSGVDPNPDVHTKGHGYRSMVKVTEVITQLSRFRTVTPVWIHIW